MELILQPRNPVTSFAGFAIVVGLHLALALGLLYGLARYHAPFMPPAPIDLVRIVAPAPPRPRPVALPPANMVTQPILVLDMPPVGVETITAVTREPVAATETTLVARGPIDSGRSMPPVNVGAACPNAQGIRSTMRYPAQARRDGLQGDVLARFIVGAGGEIRDINIVSSSHRAFNAAVMSAVSQFSCIGQGRDVAVEVPFSFRLE